MDEVFRKVAADEVPYVERRGGGSFSRDLSGALASQDITLRTWRFGPGQQMAYHRHGTQEEHYHLVSGGPQELVIEGEVVTVEDGDWLCLPKGTARRIQNPSEDREAVWLAIGAPPGEGIRDGIRIDPETGAEIPRT